MQLETEQRRQIEPQRIEATLERLAEGVCGHCVSRGEEVPAKRLELDPTNPVWVDCAESAGG